VQGRAGGLYAGYGSNGAFAGVGYQWSGFNAGYDFVSGTASVGYGGGLGGSYSGSLGLHYNVHSGNFGYNTGLSGAFTGQDFQRWASNRRIKKHGFDPKQDLLGYQNLCPNCSPSELIAMELGYFHEGNGSWINSSGHRIQAESGGFLAEFTDKLFLGSLRVPKGELWYDLIKNIERKGGQFASKLNKYLRFQKGDIRTDFTKTSATVGTKPVYPTARSRWAKVMEFFSNFDDPIH